MIKLKSLLREDKGTPGLFEQIDAEFRAGAQKIITRAGVILKKHFKQTGLYIVVKKSWNPQVSGSNTFLSVTSPEALRQIYDIEGTEAQTRKILGKITGLRKDIGWSTIVQESNFKHNVINEGYGVIKVTLPFVDEQSINKLGASHILTYRVESVQDVKDVLAVIEIKYLKSCGDMVQWLEGYLEANDITVK